MAESNQTKTPDRNWPKDEFGRGETSWQLWMVCGISVFAAVLGMLSLVRKSSASSKEVIVYCAQDQEYAEKIFKQFEKETGLRVRALYDNEAVKSVGLANRLLAERAHPRCDLFWGNEELRTRQLAAQNIFRQTTVGRRLVTAAAES